MIKGLYMYLILLQISYLIDEAVNTGKGANNIISMVHHYFLATQSGKSQPPPPCHADNCSGQNKNRYVMQYLAWHVLSGLNKSITLSFLFVGHEIFTGLVFWSFQTGMSEHQDWMPR